MWGNCLTPGVMFEFPLALATTLSQPNSCTALALSLANLPIDSSATDISAAGLLADLRVRASSITGDATGAPAARGDAASQGGARRSQDDSAEADSPWPPRQALPPPAAARRSRQKAKRRARSPVEANGTCVIRRRQFG